MWDYITHPYRNFHNDFPILMLYMKPLLVIMCMKMIYSKFKEIYLHGSSFSVFCYGLIQVTYYPHPSGLIPWHWGNHMIAPVPVKQPWRIWIHWSHESLGFNETTAKESTTKLIMFLWAILYLSHDILILVSAVKRECVSLVQRTTARRDTITKSMAFHQWDEKNGTSYLISWP